MPMTRPFTEPQRVDVSIVIVNWNSCDYLRKCLATISQYTKSVSFEVIVIDSGSFDGCDEMLRRFYPDVHCIQSRDNLGFARANNRAVRESRGSSILFLNPDTELVSPAVDVMQRILRTADRPGVIGARLLNSDGSLQTSCVQPIPTILSKVLDIDILRARCPRAKLWGAMALYENSREPREVSAVSGACCMIDRDVLDSVGGLSEDYFMYAEDIDLAYKLRRAGYRNYYAPTAVVTHHGGSSSDQMTSAFASVMMPEATWRFFRKTRGLSYAQAFRIAMTVSAAVRLLLLLVVAPLASIRGKRKRWAATSAKWHCVLKWALKRDSVSRQYYSTTA
jgi:N-acetylglucosaminyl-diphospho-decaprenol L-rhamnosyltransferase